MHPSASSKALIMLLWTTLFLVGLEGEVWAAKVIPPGKEAELVALLAPHALGEEIDEDVLLRTMQIDRDRVVLELGAADGSRAATLELRPREPSDEGGSESFSFVFSGDETARAAAQALVRSIRDHDRGGIYVVIDEPDKPPPSVVVDAPVPVQVEEPKPEVTGEIDWPSEGRWRYLALLVGLGGLWFAALMGWRTLARTRASWRDEALAVSASVAALTAVGVYAWICDDARISMRYAWNLAHGHGLVFNIGERVQGYTNPLWTLALALLDYAGQPLVAASIVLGLVCTAATLSLQWFIVRELPRVVGDESLWRAGPGPAFVLVVVLTYGCQPFLAFSSSGLESSLGHMLIALSVAAALTERAGLLCFLAALALFNRLDAAALLFPVVAWSIWSSGSDLRGRLRRCGPGLLVGALFLGAWLVFATLYYGYPMPNTWSAKGGVHLGNGLGYLLDFCLRRPSSALVLIGSCVLTLRKLDIPLLRALALGCASHIVYVVGVGGDYMHGRFWTAPLLLASLLLITSCARLARDEPRWRAAGPVLAMLTLVDFVRPQSYEGVGGVVLERDPAYGVWATGMPDISVREHHLYDDYVPELREGLTIAQALIAHGIGSDPRISLIDGYGLTDPYIARCPIDDDSRAGHFERLVPRAYLRARGDLGQIPDGYARLIAGDSGIWAEIEQLRGDPQWTSELYRQRYEELSLLTRGPIFAPERLRLIPRYTFGRQNLPPLPRGDTVDLMLP